MPRSPRLLHLGIAALLAVLPALGCSSLKKEGGSASSGAGGSAILSRLSADEQRKDIGYYTLLYTNYEPGNTTNIQVAQGGILMNDAGVLKFEQQKREPLRNVWAYFHPEREVIVAFPKLKTAYRASPAIFNAPEAERIVALYDGLRLVLGLSNAWTNPDQNRTSVSRGGTKAELTESGRTFRWDMDIDPDNPNHPFSALTAKKGLKNLIHLERKVRSVPSFKVKGSVPTPEIPTTAVQWSLTFPGSKRTADFAFDPVVGAESQRDRLQVALEPPALDSTFKVTDLTVPMVLDWLNLQ